MNVFGVDFPMQLNAVSPKYAGGVTQAVTRLPWDAIIARNQVYNRAFVEIFGWQIWQQLFARNNYERLERGFDSASYLALGTFAPIFLDKAINVRIRKALYKRFQSAFYRKPLAHLQPVAIPFELLDRTLVEKKRYLNNPAMMKELKSLGIKHLPKGLVQRVLLTKVGFMLFDLWAITTAAQLYQWGKNWVTAKLSGEKGFSGTFNLASEAYKKREAEKFSNSEANRFKLSLAVCYGGSFLLPLALYLGLRHRTAIGSRSLLGQLKKSVRWFNYTDTVYLSKWVLMWAAILNFNVAPMLAARDKNELREKAIEGAATDLFYFVGDDIISGLAAKHMQQKYAKQLKGIRLTQKGLLGLPAAIPFQQVYKVSARPAQQLANKLSRQVFWTGLIGTALCLGVAVTQLRNFWTWKKVTEEDKALQSRR